jgi:hypothetical protein
LEIVIVIVLAYFNKHGPNPSYTEDRTLSKNEERTAATRTRNLLKRLKPDAAIKFLINSTDEKFGLVTLTSMQLAEFTFESVVVTYPKRFLPHEVDEAKRRLDLILANRPKDFIYPKIERNIF